MSDRRYSALIVSSGEKFTSALMGVLEEENCYPVVTLKNVAAGRRELLEREYDIILVNAPLPDEMGANFAIDVTRESNSGVILFVPSELYDEISDKASDYGVLTVAKPTNKTVVKQTLKLVLATHRKVASMEKKVHSFEEKIEEIKVINRAKLLLMENEYYDEPMAHRYIEKTAMDTRKSKLKVAKEIIEQYQGKE